MKNTRMFKIMVAAMAMSIVVPFIMVPNHARFFSASLMLLYGTLILFYNVSQVFIKETDETVIERSFSGLPGEINTNVPEAKPKRQRKVKIDKKLPGASSKKEGGPIPEFEIIDEPVVKSPIPAVASIAQNTPSGNEIIDFWDEFSSYKVKDSQVFKKINPKETGELLDFVFMGLGTFLQRYRLTLDDVINFDKKANSNEPPYGKLAVGFVIQVVERELTVKKKMNIEGGTPISAPSGGKSLVEKVVNDKTFESQIASLVDKYYEKK